jgi:hypothetical protein
VDIVLGVSMTPTTVRMALVEGAKADGEIVDHDIFDTTAADASATPVEQVVSAVLGTRESAEEGGHHLKSVGVAWSDHDAAAQLRDALDAAGVKDVMMVSELHAAGSLAQAAGQAVGYSSTGLLFVDCDTATMSVVQPDGAISKVLSRSLHSTDAMAVLGAMAAAVSDADAAPQGMFVVGSGVDVTAVQAHLAELLDIPVNAPGDADLALARGAALASANAPMFDAATAGLAYSAAPGGVAAAAPLAAPLLTADEFGFDELGDAPVAADPGRKPFLLVGSALTSIFVVGVVALAISLAVSIRPTVDQRPAPAQAAIVPSAPVAAPVAPPAAVPPPAPAPAAVPEPAPEAVAPAPRHVDAPQVVKESAPAPQVHVPAPAPEAPAPAPAPVPVSMPDVPAAPVVPPPAAVPDPAPAVLPPPVYAMPGQQQPAWNPWAPRPRQPQWVPSDPSNGYPDYPSRGGRGHDDGGYPGDYPGNGYPGSQYPRGSNGYPGDYPGNGNGNGKKQKQPNCFLIFCAPS